MNTHLHVIDDTEYQRLVAADKELQTLQASAKATTEETHRVIGIAMAAGLVRGMRRMEMGLDYPRGSSFIYKAIEDAMKRFKFSEKDVSDYLLKHP